MPGNGSTAQRALALLAAVLLLLIGALAAVGGALVLVPAPWLARIILTAAGIHLAATSALAVGVARRQRPLMLVGVTWLALLTAAALYTSCTAWAHCGWHLAVSLIVLAYLFLTLAALLRYAHSATPPPDEVCGEEFTLRYTAMVNEEPDISAAPAEMALLRPERNAPEHMT